MLGLFRRTNDEEGRLMMKKRRWLLREKWLNCHIA